MDGHRCRKRRAGGRRRYLLISESHWGARNGRVLQVKYLAWHDATGRCVQSSMQRINIELYVVCNLTHSILHVHCVYTHTHAHQEHLYLFYLARIYGRAPILLFASFGQLFIYPGMRCLRLVDVRVPAHPKPIYLYETQPNYSRVSRVEDVRAERQSQSRTGRQTERGGEWCNVWAGYNVLTGSRTYHE